MFEPKPFMEIVATLSVSALGKTALFVSYGFLQHFAFTFFLNGNQKNLKVFQAKHKYKLIRHDLFWTLCTLFLYFLFDILNYVLISNGYSQFYFKVEDYGFPYLIFSFFLLFLIHDTYFYWTHRLFHLPRFYKWHKIHHVSSNPNSFTTFSFHPVEALVEGAFLFVLIYTLPMYPPVVIAFYAVHVVLNMYHHSGYDLYPKWLFTRWPLKSFCTPTHHVMHHKYYNANYGLYFRFWDVVMKTETPKYWQRMTAEALNSKQPQSTSTVKEMT